MFYHLLYPLKDVFFGFNLFKYITFRSAFAAVTSFLIVILFGNLFIRKLKTLCFTEKIKFKDTPILENLHSQKEGTPTMGGVLIIFSVILSVILWARLDNPFIWLTLLVLVALGGVGARDDLVKIKQNKRGISKKEKLFFQTVIGFMIGLYIYFSKGISTQLDIPFLKDKIIYLDLGYILFSALVITASSNAVNLTDGLDGLATGGLLFVSLTYTILSYLAGHYVFAKYLLIPFVKGAGELAVFCASLGGALLGFLWFNCFPAQVFLGNTGALSIGASLGCVSLFIKKELLLIIAGGIFVAETISVILQIISFRYFKKRIFKIAPLHHHFQALGYPEPKITVRFWIISVILMILALSTLKIR